MGVAAVEASDAAEAAQDIAQVAAKDAAVGVEFVDDDVAEVFEQARPARVVWQDSGVQHVWIGQDHVAFFADGFAGVGGGVSVVGENAEAILQTLVEVVKFGELVLRERFGGEEVERAGVGILEDLVQHRQVVAQRFSGSGGRDDDCVFSGVDGFRCGGLMDVQAADALGGVAGGEVSMHPSREVRPLGIACRKMAHGGEDFAVVVAGGKGVEDFVNACDGCRHEGPANCQRFGHEEGLFLLRLLFA